MKVEIEAASSWWTDHLPNHLLSAKQSLAFHSHLVHELEQRCFAHWYADAPLRGSAYRSVIHDARLDPTLESAARAAGIERQVLYQVLPRGVMWLNPGEVKIRLNGMSPNESSMIIYSSKNHQHQTTPPAATTMSSSLASSAAASVVAASSTSKDDASSSSPPPSCSSSQSSSPSPSSSPMSPPSTPTVVLAENVVGGAGNDAGFLFAAAAGSYN